MIRNGVFGGVDEYFISWWEDGFNFISWYGYGFNFTDQTVKLRSMHFTVGNSFPDKKFLGKKSELHFRSFIF